MLHDPGFENRYSQQILLFSQNIHTCCMATHLPIPQVPGFFPAVKQPRYKVNHSPPSSIEVKNKWSCDPTPPIHLHGVDGNTFNFCFLLFSIHPSIPTPSICPTNRPVQLPFCSLYIRTVQVNIHKGFYNHSKCCKMYVLLHLLLTVNDICQILTVSMHIHCQCNM